MIYGHGDDAYRYEVVFKANFSSNVWYQRTAPVLLQHLQEQLPTIANYPTPNADELAARITAHHQLRATQVVVTNGATEAFYLITKLFAGQTAAIGTPTFSEYEDACQCHGVQPVYYDRAAVLDTHFDAEVVFICNPNNPDGYCNTVAEIRQLVTAHPHTTFVIDEAYIDFTSQIRSSVVLLQEFDNLIIVRSLTKLFSIPGLRLGYILCSEQWQKKLQQASMPWSVNAMAIAAGNYIYDHYTALVPTMETLLRYSAAFQKAIDALEGYTVVPSPTNYFLVRLAQPVATQLKEYLVHTHQLLIRDASNFRGLDGHYIRIASQDSAQNQLLVNALAEWNTSE